MNILFIASDNKPYSGAFRSMVKLTTILKENFGHNILVVLPCEGDGKQLLDKNGIRNIMIRSYNWTVGISDKKFIKSGKHYLKATWFNNKAIKNIEDLIIQEKIDLVHINTSYSYVGAPAALKCNIPYIWHIREFLEEDHGRQIRNKKRGYALMRKSTKVIAISESIYEKYLPIIGKEKLTIILNGIDPSDYYVSDHFLFQDDIFQILIVGWINEGKGQKIAIEACLKLLKEGIRNFKLRIVGEGEKNYIKILMDMIKNANADKYIEFCGPSDNAVQFYSSSDIILMCSQAEAFGRVTVEAMFAGTLVIGADTAGTKDLIQDGVTGLLYKNRDVEALKDKILYAINHKSEIQDIARAGQAYMLKNMTAEINAEHINALYENIVNY